MSIRLVYITTDPSTAHYLLRGQLAFMREAGFDVSVISSPGDDLERVASAEGVRTFAVPMRRAITPFADLAALIRLIRTLRSVRPDIVNASTPKAALLGIVAAAVCRVRLRIYTLRGLRSETTRGVTRMILELMERITSALAHQVVCVSGSLRDEYLRRRLARPAKLRILGRGSSNGIDVSRFPAPPDAIERVRRDLGLQPGVVTIGFVGRLVRDKGVAELVEAFDALRRRGFAARLVLIGRLERGDALPRQIVRRIEASPDITRLDHVDDPRPYYGVFDIVAFPSYREGFPNVPLEAAACSIPVVGFHATGTSDAVVDGVTGSLVPLGDTAALTEALYRYAQDAGLRREHGAAARRRVERDFSNRVIWGELLSIYCSR